jgi:aminopeptidase N/puromycin-sensitive aminopeptidase
MHQDLVTPANEPKFEGFVRSLLRPLYDEVGFSGTAADSDDRKSLRAVLIGVLGTDGNDPDVIARARAALDRSLSGGTPLEPTVAGAIVTAAATHGDAKLFDALAAAAEKAVSPEEQYRYLFALSGFQDRALIQRGLEFSLSPQLRSQDTAIYLARFFPNPHAQGFAWAFVKEHWAALEPKVVISGGDVNLVRSLGARCDAQPRDEIAAFFAAHPLPGAARTLTQTIEQINNCIALKAAQTPAVTAWLAVH